MVLSTETFNQSVRTEYSEAVNARYTFQPLWVSAYTNRSICNWTVVRVIKRALIVPESFIFFRAIN